MEALILMGVIVGCCVLIAWLDKPLRYGPKYSGRIYDPQPRPEKRAGAVGWTGRVCPLCQKTTYGLSTRCGNCGRANALVPLVRTESTRRRALVERDAS